MVTIIRMVNIIDNWGNYEDVDDIKLALENGEWDDDTVLIDEHGNTYSVHDALDIEIKVGNDVVLIKE